MRNHWIWVLEFRQTVKNIFLIVSVQKIKYMVAKVEYSPSLYLDTRKIQAERKLIADLFEKTWSAPSRWILYFLIGLKIWAQPFQKHWRPFSGNLLLSDCSFWITHLVQDYDYGIWNLGFFLFVLELKIMEMGQSAPKIWEFETYRHIGWNPLPIIWRIKGLITRMTCRNLGFDLQKSLWKDFH